MLAWPHAIGQNILEMERCWLWKRAGRELGSLEGEGERIGGSPERRKEKGGRGKTPKDIHGDLLPPAGSLS